MVIKRLHETRKIIWPVYFDRRFSRREGRRVPYKDGLSRVTLDEVMAAAERAGLRFEVDREATHPMVWWERTGRILVIYDGPKTELIRVICQNLPREGRDTEGVGGKKKKI